MTSERIQGEDVMFGSILLDVGVGLAFTYLLLSLLRSALNEWIVRMFAMRANTLKDGIQNLLQREELEQDFRLRGVAPWNRGIAVSGMIG